LSLIDRYVLRVRHDDLFLGNNMTMPVRDAEALMRNKLAEYRQTRHDGSAAPATAAVSPAPRAPRRTRASRKR
ncbi:MAG: hypothetical protein ABSE70_04800, partial [Candidatus Limnocylindrales bacterium]